MNASARMVPPATRPSFTPVRHPLLQRCTATAECDDCKKKRLGTLQRQAAGPSAPLASPHFETNSIHYGGNEGGAPASVEAVLSSPGRPLDPGTRSFMESRFSHDFSQVRVHTDSQAARSAQAVNALAYTVGRHIVFDAGQFRPDTRAGRRLVAHELAHVVQQSAFAGAPAGELRVAGADAAEREAERTAAAVETAAPGPVSEARSGLALQRQPRVPATLIVDPCVTRGNCPPPPPPSPIPGCAGLTHRSVMFTIAREYVRTQLDPSLAVGVRSLDCFGGIGACKIEFDSGVAVEASMLLNPFVTSGIGAAMAFVEEIVAPSSQTPLKDLLHKRFGPRCAYDVGCSPTGQLIWSLSSCHQKGPLGPGDFPTPSGDERVA